MDHRPRADIVTVVKNVKGRLLRREESYTETLFPDSVDEDHDLVRLSLKAPRHESEVYTFEREYNVSPALERNVKAWSDATGVLATVTVHFRDRVFRLHEFPLVSRSGYFASSLRETSKDVIAIASDEIPVGVDVFELALNFCYGSTLLMEPTNVAEIFCVAAFLQMTEDYGRGNLCERCEHYLSQVALQSWDDAMVVLLRCETLLPCADQLGIVTRCLDAMAFMACVEVLDPVARKAKPGKTGELQWWDMPDHDGSHHWWIHDIVTLPPELFLNFVQALRREGMRENHVGQVVTAFADRWLFCETASANTMVLVQKGSDKCWVMESQQAPELSGVMESVVKALPLERNVVPVGFLVALLRRCLKCATLEEDCRVQLETRIALQLEHAALDDLLLPSSKKEKEKDVLQMEIDAMERILKLFLTRFRGYDDARVADMSVFSKVGKLWDEYLTEIAFASSITPARFAELVERVPAYMRVAHDHVYRAIHTYIKAHPGTTQEERLAVCRALNCQKLSPEACAHAVQNDLMPLRLVVQAMFMQQLQTRSARMEPSPPKSSFREHPTSHYSHAWDHSQDPFRSAGSSFRDDDLYIDDLMYAASQSVVAKEMTKPAIVPAKMGHCQVTETRLRSLEAELSKMRVALAHSMSQRASSSSSSSSSAQQYQPSNAMRTGAVELVAKRLRHSGSYRAVPTFEESGVSCCGPLGCLAHLGQPVNRTGGLLAKTLHKLRFLAGFGKSRVRLIKGVRDPVISEPILESVDRPTFDHPESFQILARHDSMPQPVTNRVHSPTLHVRHKSFS